jgi:hypothetical protein
MPREYTELPGWVFDADEISVDIYRLCGRDQAGRNVEIVGFDEEALMERCSEVGHRKVYSDRSEAGLVST